MKNKSFYYFCALVALTMLTLAGCSGGSGSSITQATDGTYKASIAGTVDVGKAVAATAGALGTVEVFNAYSTANKAPLATAEVQADGSFSGLNFTLPSTQSVVMFKATLTGPPVSKLYNLTPMDLTVPATGAGLTNNNVLITINAASTATANAAMISQGATLDTQIHTDKSFAAVSAAVIANGGAVLSYSSNGIRLTGTVNGAAGTTTGTSNGIRVADKHGVAVVTAEDELQGAPANPKFLANIKITGATADASGLAKVTFTVKKKDNVTPVSGITAVSAGIFKLAPKDAIKTVDGRNYNRWVPYIYRSGRTVNAGYRESNTTPGASLIETAPGTYSYTFAKNLATAAFAFPVKGQTLVGYDRTLTHRVSVYMGGHSGPTGEADFDFVPAGGAVTQTRNIVETATCKKCHGNEFRGHGGDRVTVEGCNTCHSPDSALVNTAANGGKTESIEMAVMIHKMHAGRELPSVAGPDGQYYDNPNTVADETADNGTYNLGNPSTWNTAAFPAVLANCQACHTEAVTGTLADVNNWKNVPSRAACGSCHDNIDFAAGTNHAGGTATNDDSCAVCHPATGNGFGKSVTTAHDFSTKDIRNIPEYDVVVTTDTPTRGYYIAGETPVVSITLKDKVTGAVISPASVIQQQNTNTAAAIAADGPFVASVGCIANAAGTDCTLPSTGKFTAANVYVNGPRAERVPVLTYAARAVVRSATVGPWDLSAGGNIRVKVDSGISMVTYDNRKEYLGYGADTTVPGDITVTLAADATRTAVTPAQVAALLNADATFSERAFAYVDEALAGNANAGKLAIRSRGIKERNKDGEVIKTTAQRSIQVVSNTLPLFTDFATKTAGAADSVRKMLTANKTVPKADFTDATAIKYTLDPVDDLVAGTYMINVEYGSRGRGPTNPAEPPYTDYKTPSIAIATFQVKTAATEKAVADNCTSCHWSKAGVGFVLDYPRHNKPFNETALDQCGGCHDYASGMKSDATSMSSWSGGLAISKRVHAVHNGANLNYPTLTVGHEETAAFGRNWRITYPMDVRNCESCHSSATSGTWKTKANRLACMGCHDSDAAIAHMRLQTYDPSPLAPWSGDEQESCVSCH